MRRDSFQAIADPNRRKIITILSTGSQTMNQLAAEFKISRPAVSKHVHILRKSGVVTMKKVSRERHFSLNAIALKAIYDWCLNYVSFWETTENANEIKPKNEAKAKQPKQVSKTNIDKQKPSAKKKKPSTDADDTLDQLSLF